MKGIDEVVNFCQRHEYKYSFAGDAPISVILIGERHRIEDLAGQEQIIQLVKPKVILHEAADPNYVFRYHTSRILAWQKKFSVPVELCDIPDYSFNKDEITKERLEAVMVPLLERLKIQRPEVMWQEMEMPLRDEIMGGKIINYVRRNETPIVACVGNKHTSDNSYLFRKLCEEYVGFMVIEQSTNST